MPIIYTLQLPPKERTALISLFGLGTIACACGVLRTVYQQQAQVDSSLDSTWVVWPFHITTEVEINIGIVRLFCLEILLLT